ncbi:hypothetical protein GQE70_15870 [Escherichia coli]|nr:hypothetical protein [Escherichia coli]
MATYGGQFTLTDNAMAESINGLYKAEVIHRKSWKNRKRKANAVCNTCSLQTKLELLLN